MSELCGWTALKNGWWRTPRDRDPFPTTTLPIHPQKGPDNGSKGQWSIPTSEMGNPLWKGSKVASKAKVAEPRTPKGPRLPRPRIEGPETAPSVRGPLPLGLLWRGAEGAAGRTGPVRNPPKEDERRSSRLAVASYRVLIKHATSQRRSKSFSDWNGGLKIMLTFFRLFQPLDKLLHLIHKHGPSALRVRLFVPLQNGILTQNVSCKQKQIEPFILGHFKLSRLLLVLSKNLRPLYYIHRPFRPISGLLGETFVQ